jgi:hypothetical protein
MNSSIFPWKTLAIASSGLVVLFIGGFLVSGNQPVQSHQTSQTYKTPVNGGSGGVVPGTGNVTPVTTKAVAKPKPPHKKAKKITVKSTDSVKATVSDEPTPLDEMIVMGMAEQANKASDDNGSNIKEAHPKNGWVGFDTYLKQKAISPDGKTGTVKLSFIVNSDGSYTGFKIRNGLSDATNQKAIDLIKNGPVWVSNADGSAKETTVNVDFH